MDYLKTIQREELKLKRQLDAVEATQTLIAALTKLQYPDTKDKKPVKLQQEA